MSKTGEQAGYKPAMSDAAVKLKTGKTWVQWFAALDKRGAGKESHRAIVSQRSEKFDVGRWWRQMVAVEYERARGLREKHETTTGYNVSVSKTIACDLSKLYDALADPRGRRKWFPQGAFTQSSATKNKYLRGAWNGSARVEIGFIAKGEGKSQIGVQIGRLARMPDVESARAVWKDALTRLVEGLA
ncbi:MAG: hypothetical protein ACREHV_11500 [Rhizomicrobium sp.]